MCSTDTTTAETAASSPDLGEMPDEWLERDITELAAHINAATCRWLLLVAEFDRRGVWAEWGCKSCADWLSYRCGVSPSTGREQVRVARLLTDLPRIRATFERGELCYSQVRALTRVATRETEQNLLELARYVTAGQLEVVVRSYRGVLNYELGREGPERRYVHLERDDDGSLLIQARLPAEEGAVVAAALEAGRDALRENRSSRSLALDGADDPGPANPSQANSGRPSPTGDSDAGSASAETTHIGDIWRENGVGRDETPSPGTLPPAPPVSNADALVLMADTLLSSRPAARAGGDGYQVVVHADAAALADDEDGSCELEDGTPLHPETARRLACDASVVRILERDGRPLSVGRKRRSVPPALRRALKSRDRVCRFPGCAHRRFLHAHHIEHWARGGRTDLSNLIHLCSHHHRLLHEGGYRIERGAGGALHFRRPDGRAIPTVPPRPTGDRSELRRQNDRLGLTLTDTTCVPDAGDRLDRAWVVNLLCDDDPRLHPGERGHSLVHARG
jgi:Domain of unknown function (DUF222)/HNH endonuclease